MSPRQVSTEYRNQQLRTLIGFGVYHRKLSGHLACLNVDLLSNNQGQTGFDTVNAFRLVKHLFEFNSIL
jgi:hypothetical protein